MIGILIVLTVLTVYVVWDNNRITIEKQEIVIEDLPEQLAGFSVVQITDLHEKEFGENQKRLIEAINSIQYDALVFTGDMLDGSESTNYKPFYSIVEGINNKENMFYVPGNADPESYQTDPVFEKSEFVKGMEKRGVTFLESIDTIQVDGANVHFVNFELSIMDGKTGVNTGIPAPNYATDEQFLTHQKQLLKEMTTLGDLQNPNVVIALDHYPVVDTRIDHIMNMSDLALRDYDLLIAGHYHGGQIRLPFFGALFVPEAWDENSGLFPPGDRVKGLWEYEGVKQYVSTGLGSSDAISFLKFRLFNPPQINVLTLKEG